MTDMAQSRNVDSYVQNVQLRVGVVVLGATMAAAVVLLAIGAGPTLRALLFAPFFVGIYALVTGLSGTCPFTAYRRKRLTFAGAEPMARREDVAANRRRGIWQLAGVVVLSATATGLLLTAR